MLPFVTVEVIITFKFRGGGEGGDSDWKREISAPHLLCMIPWTCHSDCQHFYQYLWSNLSIGVRLYREVITIKADLKVAGSSSGPQTLLATWRRVALLESVLWLVRYYSNFKNIYSLPVISGTRILVGWCGVLSLIDTDGTIPVLKTLLGDQKGLRSWLSRVWPMPQGISEGTFFIGNVLCGGNFFWCTVSVFAEENCACVIVDC